MSFFDPYSRLISSPIYSHRALALQRLALAVYGFATLVTSLVYEAVVLRDGTIWFSYFTHLTLIGLSFYFLFSSFHGFKHEHKKDTPIPFLYPLQRWPRYLQHLHMLLMSTVTTFPLLVTICYWALIASPSTFATPYDTWSAISFHIFNTIFTIIEIGTTNIPPLPWKQLPLCVLILLGYLALAYVTYADQHVYTYTFLDIEKQGAKLAAYIVGIAIGEVVIFILVRYVIVLRDRIINSKSKSNLTVSNHEEHGNGGKKNNKEGLNDWEKVNWENDGGSLDGVQRKDITTTFASSSVNSSPKPNSKEKKGGSEDNVV